MQSASYAKYQTVSKRELISGFPPSISCTKYKNTGCPGKAQGSRYFFNAQCQTDPGRPLYKTQRKISGLISEAASHICPQAAMRDFIIKAHDLMRGRRLEPVSSPLIGGNLIYLWLRCAPGSKLGGEKGLGQSFHQPDSNGKGTKAGNICVVALPGTLGGVHVGDQRGVRRLLLYLPQ